MKKKAATLETIDTTILSFDVGVCNLAYCVIHHKCDPTNSQTTVQEWGKINLCLEMRNCECEGCAYQAIYATKDDPTPTRCKEHKQEKQILAKPVRKSKNTDLMREIFYEWLTRRNWDQIDNVVIENQPALKNPGMKTMACAIYDYFFLTKKIFNKQENFKIKFVSPMNKTRLSNCLSWFDQEPIIPDEIKNIEPKYKQTKLLAVWLSEHFFENEKLDGKNVIPFHTKKDDLADALLQGLVATLK